MSKSFSAARALILATATSLALAAPAISAESKPGEEKKPAVEKKAPPAPQLSLGEQIGESRRKLADIREAALKANPKLVQRQEKLDALILKAVRKQGVDPEKDEKRLAEIREEIREMNKGKFDQKRRLALSDEHRTISLRLAKAREAAMQDEKVKNTGEALREDILAAMNKEEPKTKELLAELEQLSARARDLNAQQRQRR